MISRDINFVVVENYGVHLYSLNEKKFYMKEIKLIKQEISYIWHDVSFFIENFYVKNKKPITEIICLSNARKNGEIIPYFLRFYYKKMNLNNLRS